MATCRDGHKNMTRLGTNGFRQQIKCKTCGKLVFEWWTLETAPDQVDKALEGHYVPVRVHENLLEEKQKLLDAVLEENNKLLEANEKLRKSNDKRSKALAALAREEESEGWEKVNVPPPEAEPEVFF